MCIAANRLPDVVAFAINGNKTVLIDPKQTLVVAFHRIWQAFAGLVTAVIVVHALTPEAQGWYYSLLNAAAMFTLFDLGLSLILVQRSAALNSQLALSAVGEPLGDNALKFRALAAFSFRWYRALALGFLVLLWPGGLYFFSLTGSEFAPDMLPLLWLALVLATSVNLWLLPSLSLVEGSGDLASVYGLRLAQGVLGAMGCWLVLFCGGGAWASLALPLVAAALGLYWLLRLKPGLFRLRYAQQQLEARATLWSLQWRLGLIWGSGFLLTQIYVPILLAFDEPVAAGQLGLTLAIANMIALISQSWLTSAYPRMASCAAQQNWHTLFVIFQRVFLISMAFYLLAVLGLSLILMHPSLATYAQRLLPQATFLALLGAIFINQICAALAAHIRASGREPFVWVTLMTALLTLLGVLVLVGDYGVNGLVTVMLTVQILFALPLYIWVWRVQLKQLESAL